MTPIERSEPEIGTTIATRTQPMFHRILTAHPTVVRDTLRDVRERFHGEVSEDTLGRLELVLAEVMNNVTEHSPGLQVAADKADPSRLPVIHLCIVRHVAGLACALTDDGVSLPDECILPRNLPAIIPDNLPEGGFGWFLIQDLTQALCYYREESRNYLAFNVPFAQLQDDDAR